MLLLYENIIQQYINAESTASSTWQDFIWINILYGELLRIGLCNDNQSFLPHPNLIFYSGQG